MSDTNPVRPTVSEILRASGARPAEVIAAAPDLSPHTVRAIFLGRISGTTLAAPLAEAMKTLAESREGVAEQYSEAADAIARHYPPAPVVERPEPPKSDTTDHIVYMAERGKSLTEAGAAHGISREAARQRVKTHEKRTGTKVPRYGK